MKYIKKAVVLVLAAALILSLAGCSGGKMTAKKLIDNMVEASQQLKLTESMTAMELEMTFSASGMDFNVSTAMLMETKISYEPYASYTKMETAMDFMGQQMAEITETYSVEEDGKVVTYVYTSTGNQWAKQDTGVTVEQALAQDSGYSWMQDKVSDFHLSEHEHTVNGKPVYILTCTLTGDELDKTMGGMGGIEDMFSSSGMGDANIGDISIPTTFYVDAEQFMPVKVEMDINGLGHVLSASMASALGDAGMQINVSKATAIYEGLGYDPVEVPEVPAEVLELQ